MNNTKKKKNTSVINFYTNFKFINFYQFNFDKSRYYEIFCHMNKSHYYQTARILIRMFLCYNLILIIYL